MSGSVSSGGQRARHRAAADLQLDDDSGHFHWADTADERARGALVDRLAGDRYLVGQLLRPANFAGPEWERAAEELVRYGVSVLTAWMLRGTIFEKCARRGRPIERPPADSLDEAEALSMAGEVVTVSLAHFRNEVLLAGRWDPSRGASLTTYFIGQCILRFPNIYRRWLATVRNVKFDEHLSIVEGRRHQTIEDDVIYDRLTTDALRLVKSEDARRAILLSGYGYTQSQIAERLGKTDKAVERMLDYARRQIRKGERSA
jgi:hypothetical protein